MFHLWIFISILIPNYAKVIPFKDCGSVGGKMSTLDMNPCDDTVSPFPCVLHRGTNYSMAVNFTATENANKLTTKVYGIFPDVPPFLFLDMDSCAAHNVDCPMVSGKAYTYTNSIFCSKIYPKVKLAVKWEMLDENGTVVFCFIIPTEIFD